MQPDQKQIVITGGLGGIGRPLLDRLLDAGAEVTVIGRSARKPANHFRYLRAELSDPRQVQTLAEHLRENSPDILINMAAINQFCLFDAQPPRHIEQMLQINLLAPMMLARAVVPGMLSRGSGQIVNVGSVLGGIGAPLMAGYCASKAGLRGFSEALRRELAGRGVTVTHVNPRAVRTPMNDGALGEFNRRTGTTQDEPERVADHIYSAMARDAKEVSLGIPERFGLLLNTLLPVLVDDALISRRHVGESLIQPQLQESTR